MSTAGNFVTKQVKVEAFRMTKELGDHPDQWPEWLQRKRAEPVNCYGENPTGMVRNSEYARPSIGIDPDVFNISGSGWVGWGNWIVNDNGRLRVLVDHEFHRIYESNSKPDPMDRTDTFDAHDKIRDLLDLHTKGGVVVWAMLGDCEPMAIISKKASNLEEVVMALVMIEYGLDRLYEAIAKQEGVPVEKIREAAALAKAILKQEPVETLTRCQPIKPTQPPGDNLKS